MTLTTGQFHHRFRKAALKAVLGTLLRWKPLVTPEPGFSLVLGVPWDLRHILNVNLRFVAATDISDLKRVHVVFDRRPRVGGRELIARTRADFPHLPLTFRFYDRASGWIVERVNISTFYNSMNTVLALAECTTKYAVLHDFDLYPLKPNHFTSIVEAMRSRRLRFSGHELTNFDGLTDADMQIGTWTLGIDVEWLRATHRPIDCFHRSAQVRDRWTRLDPYAWLQLHTPDRDLAGTLHPTDFCHVRNLCSTYLRFLKREPLQLAWRLHYLWYLESLSGVPGRLLEVSEAMKRASASVLSIDRLPADFHGVHATCANVLRTEVSAMELALFGVIRPEVVDYVDAFERFLIRFGDAKPIFAADGSSVWSPPTQKHHAGASDA